MKSYSAPTLAILALLSSSLAYSQDRATRPDVSEKTCPVEVIEPPTRDGKNAIAVVRKPPGNGPFPAVILLHAGMGRKELKRGVDGAKEDALHSQQHTRFLSAGYVTVSALRRGSKRDPQSPDSMSDCLAVVEFVKKMPDVDPQSVVVFGQSGGGSLALELAGQTPLAAIVAGEPATILYMGMLNKDSPDQQTILKGPMQYYTPALRKHTREKIARISCPVLICQGDQHPINKVNNEVFVPELRHVGTEIQVITYPGQPHSFFFGSLATGNAGKKVFDDAHAFFRKHLPTQPVPLEESLVTHVPLGRR